MLCCLRPSFLVALEEESRVDPCLRRPRAGDGDALIFAGTGGGMLPLPPRLERPPVALRIYAVERHLGEVDAVAGDVAAACRVGARDGAPPGAVHEHAVIAEGVHLLPPHGPIRHLMERVHAYLVHLMGP